MRLGTVTGSLSLTSLSMMAKSISYSFSISPAGTTNEGSAVTISQSTINATYPLTLYYTVTGTGITTGDYSPNSGTVTFANSSATLVLTMSADATTEGNETATITFYSDAGKTKAVGNTLSWTIGDTSLTPQIGLYWVQDIFGITSSNIGYFGINDEVAHDNTNDVTYAMGKTYPGSPSRYNIFKFDSSGNAVWCYQPTSNIAAYNGKLVVDSAGNVIVGLECYPADATSQGSDIYVLKISSAGSLLYSRRLYGPGTMPDSLTAIRVDSSNNVFVQGYGYSASPSGYTWATVAKLTSTLTVSWIRRISPAAEQTFLSTGAVDSTGALIFPVYRGSYASSTVMLAKVPSGGTAMTIKTLTGSGSAAYISNNMMAVDSSNNVYFSCLYRETGTVFYSALIKMANDFSSISWAFRFQASSATGSNMGGTVIVGSDGYIYYTSGIPSTYGTIYKLNASNGSVVWNINYTDTTLQLSQVDSSGNLYFNSLKSGITPCTTYIIKQRAPYTYTPQFGSYGYIDGATLSYSWNAGSDSSPVDIKAKFTLGTATDTESTTGWSNSIPTVALTNDLSNASAYNLGSFSAS